MMDINGSVIMNPRQWLKQLFQEFMFTVCMWTLIDFDDMGSRIVKRIIKLLKLIGIWTSICITDVFEVPLDPFTLAT